MLKLREFRVQDLGFRMQKLSGFGCRGEGVGA